MDDWIDIETGWIMWPTDTSQLGEERIVNQKLAQQKPREANAVKRYEERAPICHYTVQWTTRLCGTHIPGCTSQLRTRVRLAVRIVVPCMF